MHLLQIQATLFYDEFYMQVNLIGLREEIAKRAWGEWDLVLRKDGDSIFIEVVQKGTLPTERAVEHGVEADALPCGHNQGIEFGESSWSCVVCGQPVRRSR